jgi:glycosyltransferase involved in cell wall biosynthesis
MKKILFVCFSDSIHAARWIASLDEEPWQRFVFPAFNAAIHPEFGPARRTTGLVPWVRDNRQIRVGSIGPRVVSGGFHRIMFDHFKNDEWRAHWLEYIIRRFKPDLVHSIEFQHAGYLCLKVAERMGDAFPPWYVTNYGSDIYLFGRLSNHQDRIARLLSRADFYSAECQRDVELAKQMGLRGKVMPVIPNAGGFDLDMAVRLRNGPPSTRKEIVVKGYQHFAGRALTALKAIEIAAPKLAGYTIRIYSATPDVVIAAQLLARETKLPIICYSHGNPLPHDEMLSMHGRARVSMGIGIADGVSTSFLEAVVMGSFPIQTCTACADEWIEDAVSGYIVSPDDPHLIAARLVRALEDDALVDGGAEINWRTAQARLEKQKVANTIAGIYREILGR